MDFDLSEEQRLLQDSVTRLMADRYGFEARKGYAARPPGWSRELWTQYAELGLLGLAFDEKHGGSGGGAVETMIVMEAFGRGLALEPYVPTVVLGAGLIQAGGSAAQQDALLPAVAKGELLLAFAHTERQSRYALDDVATTAKRDGAGWVLNGQKAVVLHGDSADKLLVTARVAGGQRDRAGIGLFLVDGDAGGVGRRGAVMNDGHRAAEVTFSNVKLGAEAAVGEAGAALPLIEAVVDRAIAALAAEAVGCMATILDTTVDYLKTRTQFGTTIGKFQVLQHRAVDMMVAMEAARSMTMYATMMLDDPDPSERARAIAAAKLQLGRSAKYVGQQAIQLHGGIGMTMEYKVGHYFKRVTAIDLQFGDAAHYQKRLAALGGLYSAAG
jgi:pimeloyl-CoA dehydrogenase small subunit